MSYIINDSDVMVFDLLLTTLKKTVTKDDYLYNLIQRGGKIIDPFVKKMNKKYEQMEASNTD